ncbi:putative ribokinase [Polyrhizophydium stewartii]|uniref:Ribokinase n=1 Tax=Polyrhizophydium stewartii TaxID=2732419 RepID=A0ABR4NG34_9FUNG|nr:hypothetical protein HK105_004986 [Polyrhizophydium stewartii]
MHKMDVVVFGSINIDDIYTVPDIAQPGQTIACTSFTVLPGGKGANQSVALAKAGIPVMHAGRVGRDGTWLLDLMRSHGVDTALVAVDDVHPTGRAIIQVSAATGDNAIVLNPGANHLVSHADADAALAKLRAGDLVLLQNEHNVPATAAMMRAAHARDLVVCLNPAPCPDSLAADLPLDCVDVLVLNDSESASLMRQLRGVHGAHGGHGGHLDRDVGAFVQRCSDLMLALPAVRVLVITLGPLGAVAGLRHAIASTPGVFHQPVDRPVSVVDTTGAGDTFVGFLCAGFVEHVRRAGVHASDAASSAHRKQLVLDAMAGRDGETLRACVRLGIAAAGLCCEQPGAMTAIPLRVQVDAALGLA